HEPGARLRYQLAHARVLRLGGAAHGGPRDRARPGAVPSRCKPDAALADAVQGTGPACRPSPHPAHPLDMSAGLHDAVEQYHGLLSDDVAAESQAALDAALQRRGLFFGERPLCTVLRPRLLTAGQYRFVRERCAVLLSALGRAYRAACESEDVRRQFGLMEWEEGLIQRDPGFPDPSPTSRIDAFYLPDQGVLKVTEYNAETPAGAAYGDALAEVFLALPVMRQFLRRFDVRPLPARHGVLHALLAAYRSWSGVGSPRIAILDWREVPTYSEFVLFQEYFRSHGLEAVIADARAAIGDHIPWTRMVAERMTTHAGRTVDLVPFIVANRDRLVLKPNDEYGGKGIVLGWSVDDAAWERAVRAALNEAYVVQERVP